MNRIQQNGAIDDLIKAVDSPLTWEEARNILEKFGWDVDRAAQSMLMSSSVVFANGGIADSGIERDFRDDQNQAFSDSKGTDTTAFCTDEPEGPVVLDFGRSSTETSNGPLVIRAVPTHVLECEVRQGTDESGTTFYSIFCKWHVESGLPVTDIILYPRDAPEGTNSVAHKYAEGESCLNGSVSFDYVDRGIYDVRIYGKDSPYKPVCGTEKPLVLGLLANLSTKIHDGNAVCITVSADVDGKKAELQVKPKDWIGLFKADEKDNTVLYERGAYKYCSEIVDGQVDMRLPRFEGEYQFRYFDSDSPSGVCCGVSDVIKYTPRDSMEPLAYSTSTGILRIQWSCFSREPSNWFWIGIYSDAKAGDGAKRETWNWCCKGQLSSTGEHGLLDLEVPKNLANIISSRTDRCWELQDLELRFYASSSEFLFKQPLPSMPPEPAAGSSLNKSGC